MPIIDYEKYIIDIPDYPEPGVIFKDVTPLIGTGHSLVAAVDEISAHFAGRGITKIIAPEARGFLIGCPVAYHLCVGFVPARKPGKLPRAVNSESYSLEYGTDTVEVHADALTADDKVLVVDDLAATAGTAIAVAKLVEKVGAQVAGFAFLMELSFLHPRQAIARAGFDQEVFSLIQVD
jgi:adenine phosphoribosyltransferase